MITDGNINTVCQSYRSHEKLAFAENSYAEIRTFSPLSFAEANFPTRLKLSKKKEMVRFADIMSELAPDSLITDTFYSSAEIQSINSLRESTFQLTGIEPYKGPLTQIPIYRAIHALDPAKQARILEIGGGSGHLGAMLIKDGYNYSAVEITESLFLWQSFLFQKINQDFRVVLDNSNADLNKGNALYPWWIYAKWWNDTPSFDIIIVEAALCEMSPFSLYYLQKLSRLMLNNSSVGALVFRRLGEPRQMQPNQVADGFAKYDMNGKNVDGISFYSHAKHLELNQIPPVGGGPLSLLGEYTQTNRTESYDFFDFLEIVRK